MLKLIFMSIAMLLLPLLPKNKSWHTSASTLLITTTIMLTLLMPKLNFQPMMTHTFYLDTMALALMTLTMWISALMMMASYPVLMKNQNPKTFMFLVMFLNMILLITFCVNNFILFYIMFEASLIPTLLLILGWGYQPERLQAGAYLILYTVAASLPLLISMLLMFSLNKTMHMNSPMLTPNMSTMLYMWWLITIGAFLVKMPLYSMHLWLPKAHVEAPVAGSMVLAGILLKLGSYGLLRISTPFMHMNLYLLPMISSVAMWGATLTAMICLRQPDLKSLIAYSSVGHMGLLTAGTMSSNSWGWEGALSMSVAHGLCSSALFALANMTYETTQTRSLFLTKGMMSMFPAMTFWWFILSATNMAAPPTINLLSEIYLLTSILSISSTMILPIAMSSFLAAAYSLYLFTATQHGHPPMFKNSLNLFSTRNYTIIFLHAIPLSMLILKTDLLILWL
nr:NADH dehydrogenase subunit 4 [Abarenicola claparedi oceanica]